MSRLQIDFIDKRTRLDKVSYKLFYCWIFNCIDHVGKYSWAFSLKNELALEVATRLRKLFFVFGPPRISQSDNGREFVSVVSIELKTFFPDLVSIRGRLRHPQSQGCIERANGVLCNTLGKRIFTDDSYNYSLVLSIVYGINTRISSVSKTAPYQSMFGRPSRADSDLWRISS
jgi:hypothetical protein